ncbi:MAG: NAD(P)/FAD-dependent oxidoreductase, partial [Chloroflexi bacterium]|nr:NAD(P)/FAD-dependent oxidoreductase [Chloroflexota bacterium]
GIIGKECADRFPPDPAQVYSQASAGVVVSPGGKRYRVAKNDPQALIVNRVAYVNSFAERAMAEGADYQLGPRVTGVEISRRGVSVQTTNGRCDGQMLIVASGFGLPLLRMAGLPCGKSFDYMVSCQAQVETRDLEETEVYLGSAIAPGSFGWLVPLSDSDGLIGLLTRQRLDGQMQRFLSEQMAAGKVRSVVTEPRFWGIPARPLPKTYGDRLLVVGDAAGLVKPTTGGGIYYALQSGEMAANAAVEALESGDFSAKKLRSYERSWKAVFGKELRVGYYARALFESLSEEQVERLLEVFMSSEVVQEMMNSRDFSFDWHGRVILRAIRNRQVLGLMRSFGPMAAPMLARLVRARFAQ